jgi:hypothetical protein
LPRSATAAALKRFCSKKSFACFGGFQHAFRLRLEREHDQLSRALAHGGEIRDVLQEQQGCRR